MSCDDAPPLGSILYLHTIPPVGGDTVAVVGSAVVGVVDDIAWRQLRADPPPVAYRLLGDADFTAPVAILARTAGDPSTALGAMRASGASDFTKGACTFG